MSQQIENFARFYAALKRIPNDGDAEELKKSLVASFTDDRTTSLKEVTKAEYEAMCSSMEKIGSNAHAPGTRVQNKSDPRKKARSTCLHQMQLYGVNTADWKVVNKFCSDKRIAGKEFRELSIEELEDLTKKLRAMRAKQR